MPTGSRTRPADTVLDGLRKVCDDRARTGTDADAVAGVPTRYVAAPATTAETAEVMSLAAQHDLTVVARGAGTKLGWGLPPSSVDLVVDTTGLAGVVEHVAGDLVCVVGAGTPLEELQSRLAGSDQQLALDVPIPGATLGGTIAVSTSGPRRLLYGTMRDLLIGVTFVRADGVVAKAGGKVVKNVAGYDFGKLLTGSYGTLGLLTEVVVRLHPLPSARRVVTVRTEHHRAVGPAAAAVLGSQLVPAAVEVDQPGDGPARVTVLLEGIEQGVDARGQAVLELLEPLGDATVTGEPPADFAAYPFTSDGTGLKVTSSMSGFAGVLAAARDLSRELGVEVAVRGSAVGVLHAGLPAGTAPDTAATVVDRLRATSATYGGSLTVLTAPADVRGAVDVWGPVPGLDLMRRVKHEMDPGHRLAPGRFVGGI
ncbi:MAG TPA: FAD-binding oxidoreductase [Actinomycetes bacterium]